MKSKLTTRERRLGIRQISSEDNARVTSNWMSGNTGKMHKNILADIEKLVKEISPESDGLDLSREIVDKYQGFIFEEAEYVNSRGKTYRQYLMNDKAAILLYSGYDVKYRADLILELEEAKRIIIEGNKDKGEYNVKRIDVVDSNKLMSKAVKEHRDRLGKKPKYAMENVLVFMIVFGMRQDKNRENHGLDKGEDIRPHLTPDQLSRLEKVEKANAMLLNMDMSYEDRKKNLRRLNVI